MESYSEEHSENFKTMMLCAPTITGSQLGISIGKEADFLIDCDRSSKNLSAWFYKNGTEFQMINQRIHRSFKRRLQ